MIKFKRLPANILELLTGAVEYLESHPKVVFAYIFGGLAKRRPFPLSDVDIAFLSEIITNS
jgi:predicted nucleotidyltransferase